MVQGPRSNAYSMHLMIQRWYTASQTVRTYQFLPYCQQENGDTLQKQLILLEKQVGLKSLKSLDKKRGIHFRDFLETDQLVRNVFNRTCVDG